MPEFPVITMTGEEEVFGVLSRVVRLDIDIDVVDALGTLELEIIELLEAGEEDISGEEMLLRAKAKGADLRLSHAQVFLANYQRESFGIPPEGSTIVFPGTILHEGIHRGVPCLVWNDVRWSPLWLGLDQRWGKWDRLVRPRSA